MSACIHPKCPWVFTQKMSTKSRGQKSTRIYKKCPREFTNFVYKNLHAAPQLSALQTMEMPLDGANTADS